MDIITLKVDRDQICCDCMPYKTIRKQAMYNIKNITKNIISLKVKSEMFFKYQLNSSYFLTNVNWHENVSVSKKGIPMSCCDVFC